MSFDWLTIAKRLEAIVQIGLTYSENEYDRERYEEIRSISHQILNEYTDTPLIKIRELFGQETGYPTAKVDIRAVIFRGDKILLVQEKSDGHWSLPGGWADVGFTPSEVAVKEVKEEAGLVVTAEKILAILDKKCHQHPPSLFHVYKIFLLCNEKGGKLSTGIETSDVNFFELENLPSLSTERITHDQIGMVFDQYKKDNYDTVFD
jgi:ADP-ribose pyrophosphatase YjhB (NUDIX family)